MTDQTTEPLLDAREVRSLLHCSLPFVYKLADRGRLACVRWDCLGDKDGRAKTMVRFKKNDVLHFIERHYKST